MANDLIEESDALRLKRYEELYSLTQDGVRTGIERYRLQDEKAAKYLTALNLLLAIVALAGKEALSYLLPSTYFIDSVCLALVALSILLVLVSLGLVLRVISKKKERALEEPPVNDELLTLFDSSDYMTAIYAMSRTNIAVVEMNRKSTTAKAETLQHGANTLLSAVVVFGLFIGAFSIRLSLHPSGGNMQKTEPSTNLPAKQHAGSASNQVPLPDTSVRPLKPMPVSEGAIPAPKDPPKVKSSH
jgi:hypothetical protein